MSTPGEVHQESEAVSLVSGLVVILGLLLISVIAIAGPAWLGPLFGVAVLAVAWACDVPYRRPPLRLLTGLMGALAVAWSVLRLFVP